jgi:hypothetical protein
MLFSKSVGWSVVRIGILPETEQTRVAERLESNNSASVVFEDFDEEETSAEAIVASFSSDNGSNLPWFAESPSVFHF